MFNSLKQSVTATRPTSHN